ncbi:class I SAM-dependent methyltransferase [Emticicia fontis]
MQQRILIAVLPDKDKQLLSADEFISSKDYTEQYIETRLILTNASLLNHFSSSEYLLLIETEETGKIHKVVFEYARAKNYDFVALLSTAQYHNLKLALPKIILPMQEGKAYITIGDKVPVRIGLVNFIQRKVFKKKLNLFPQICIYHIEHLARIPYLFNADDETFVNEIAIQIVLSDFAYQEIRSEVPVAITYQAKLKIIGVLLRAYLHTLGIFYLDKFDIIKDNLQYSLKLGYASSHTYAIEGVPAGSKVIDIGAGPYGIGHELKKKNCSVVTLDQFDIPDEFKLDKHIIADLNKSFSVPTQEYDCILFLDILEHIVNPEQFMFQLSKSMGQKKQKLILTTANIGFFALRIMLFLGYFNYGKSGILDKTHTRLFTFSTFKRLITDAGLKITRVRGIPAPYPKSIGDNFFSRALLAINLAGIWLWKNMFSYQIYIEAESTPSVLYMFQELLKADEKNTIS